MRSELSIVNAWILALSRYKSEMRSSRLYVIWPILFPASYTLLFVILKPIFAGITPRDFVTYSLFVFTGFSLWQTWLEALKLQLGAVRGNKALLAKSDLNTTTLFVSNLFFIFMQLIVKLLIIIILSLIFRAAGFVDYLWLIAFSLAVLLNGSVIGLILQPISTLYSDVSKVIQSISLALILSGGVVFEIPANLPNQVYVLLSLNPVGPLIDAARHGVTLSANIFSISPYIWAAITVSLLIPGLFISRKTLPILLERVGA